MNLSTIYIKKKQNCFSINTFKNKKTGLYLYIIYYIYKKLSYFVKLN